METNSTTLELKVVKESDTNEFPEDPSAEKVSKLIDGTPWSLCTDSRL